MSDPLVTETRNSPDESIHGAPHGNVNVNKITLPPTRDLILGTLLATSILCNFFLYAYAKDAKTLAWVTADALQKFQTTQLPTLQSRIDAAEELTKAYGLKESLEYHYHQPSPSEKAVGSDRRSSR